MSSAYPDVHASEWSWVGTKFDHTLNNNGTIQELYDQVEDMLKTEAALFARRIVLDLV